VLVVDLLLVDLVDHVDECSNVDLVDLLLVDLVDHVDEC